jgi:DNA-binding transcriptional MerR regulator
MITLVPGNLDNLVTTTEAADACGVGKSTISMWAKRGHLSPSGLDEHNRPLYKLIDVLRAARDTRHRAIGKGRIA